MTIDFEDIRNYCLDLAKAPTSEVCPCQWRFHEKDLGLPETKRRRIMVTQHPECPVHTKEGLIRGYLLRLEERMTQDAEVLAESRAEGTYIHQGTAWHEEAVDEWDIPEWRPTETVCALDNDIEPNWDTKVPKGEYQHEEGELINPSQQKGGS